MGIRRSDACSILCLGAAGVFFAAPAQAARERPFFQASRALAMGDAYTAVDAGFEAVYYNPAGVANRNAPQLKIFDIEATGSQSMASLVSSFASSFSGMSGITQEVARQAGTPYSAGLALLPQFLVRNLSVGAVLRSYTEAYVDPTTKNMNFFAFTDLALYAHLGVALWGGRVKLGAGVKALDRAEINRTYTPSEYASGLSFSSQWQEGTGYGLDLGALCIFPMPGLPTIGVALEDVGNTTLLDRRVLFSGSAGIPGAPPLLRQKLNVGFAVTLKHDRGVKTVLSLEEKDVLEAKSVSEAQDRFHAGAEFNIQNAFFLRGGVNQGRYWTAGLGVRLGPAGLEFASYGENVAFNSGQRVDDRKFVGRLLYAF